MSVIDDNDLKLLKMREKLLEVSNDKNKAFNDYKEIVCEIDKKMYKSITDMIRSNTSYSDYPLEKQLEIFVELDKNLVQYFTFYNNAKSISKKYGNDIVLSNLELINVSEIKKRVSAIKDYFENNKIIEVSKNNLDRLNSELIAEDKKATLFRDRISRLDEELKQDILRVEGRIYNANGQIEYTNILKEAESLGIDLKQLFNNPSELKRQVDTVRTDLNDANERMKTAQLCYSSRPTIEYKDIYYSIRNEVIRKEYKLTFLEIIELFSDYADSYEAAIEKRKKIEDKISKRTQLLNQINVKYLYDPFERINIKTQLDTINAYGDNSEKLRIIKKEISDISADVDRRVNQNRDFIDYFKKNIELYNDNTLFEDILDREGIDTSKIDSFASKKDNKVVRIVSLDRNFNKDRAIEKANGVVRRVYQMMNDNSKENSKPNSYEVSPQLVIENSKTEDAISNNNDEGVFLDLPFEVEVSDSENTNISTLEDNANTEINTLDDKDIFVNEEVVTATHENEPPLFQEVLPFEKAVLFDDKREDGVDSVFVDDKVDTVGPINTVDTKDVTTNNVTVDVMPDAFWTTKEEPEVVTGDGEALSFDEQIASLVENEASTSKVRKLVS